MHQEAPTSDKIVVGNLIYIWCNTIHTGQYASRSFYKWQNCGWESNLHAKFILKNPIHSNGSGTASDKIGVGNLIYLWCNVIIHIGQIACWIHSEKSNSFKWIRVLPFWVLQATKLGRLGLSLKYDAIHSNGSGQVLYKFHLIWCNYFQFGTNWNKLSSRSITESNFQSC